MKRSEEIDFCDVKDFTVKVNFAFEDVTHFSLIFVFEIMY